MECEKCRKPHDGSYGSGRFCTSACARSFSTSKNLDEINSKRSAALVGRSLRVGSTWNEYSAEKHRATFAAKYADLPFEELSIDKKRNRVLEYQNFCCSKCGISEWNGIALTLEMDHINGDNADNRRENLECLCPNCHSQTPTWRGRNKSKYKLVTDKDLLNALNNTKSIRQALIMVGLSPKGNNYKRAKQIRDSSSVG